MSEAKILIVEDNPDFRNTLLTALMRGLSPSPSIAEAADGEEALKLFSALKPDVVSMDVRLPGANGLDLTRTFKEIHPFAVVFVLTSYDLPEYRTAAGAAGVDHFLCKGDASLTDIVARLKTILSPE